ncbi:MAG: undecaprenyl-diphosphate phosphatase [Sulfurovaceae bacterium]|nr:undecaprenyl-diphosphate phosphatase [Sulfurovaceae bacterium]MDD5547965.1 undecaprenyl-diphosphate phosphatase [Sulfurovaceae bacterium]
MDLILILQATIMGIVEGLTEFLPISSTGHLILTGSLLGLKGKFWESFDMAIQFGAIIAVIWEFREKISKIIMGMIKKDSASWRFAINVMVACLPAGLLALAFEHQIKSILFNPISVAIALVVGGFIILWAEHIQEEGPARVQSIDNLSLLDALKVGIAQIAALIPGTSRSGSTIIGGMLFGFSRQAATEFSFFMAIPILFAASLKELFGIREYLDQTHIGLFLIGFVFSFISAFICVRWLLKFVSTNNFKVFAWYRIVFGIIILITWMTGVIQWNSAS